MREASDFVGKGTQETPWFALVVTGAYALLLAALLSQHEMWADEIQAWLLARDSDGIAELLANLKYEGHPPLWHLLLMPLARFTNNPAAMQIAHWAIAVAAVYIIVRHAPFSKWQRALLPFGYYPLFEYGAVSRNYALGILLAVAACALLPRWRRRPWRIGAILVLMSLTSVYACVLAAGLVAGLLVDWALAQRAAGRPLGGPAKLDYRPLVGLALAVAAAALCVVLLANPAEDGGRAEWRFRFDPALLAATVAAAMHAFVPPMDTPRFWFGVGESVVPFAQGIPFFLPLLLLIAALNLRHPPALTIYLVCVAGLGAFCYLKFVGHARHHGFFLVAFLVLCWGRSTLWHFPFGRGLLLLRAQQAVAALLTVWLAAHAASGVRAAAEDFARPFSNGKRAAAFIDAQGLSDLPMLGSDDTVVNGVVGHLQRKRAVRYVQGNRDGTFARRKNGWPTHPSDATVLALAFDLADASGKPVLVIDVDEPIEAPAAARGAVRHLASFTRAIAGHDLHLYMASPFETAHSKRRTDVLGQ